MSDEKTIRIQDNLGRGNYYGFPLKDVRAALEAQGLYIVNAKDKDVLCACSKLDLSCRPEGLVTCYDGHREVELTEWLRREEQ